MAQFSANGIEIEFPYEPYEVQKIYMQKVIECLQKGFNGMLESPTGTGKTLSLLCASMAWLESKKAQQQLHLLSPSLAESGMMKKLSQDLMSYVGTWDSPTNFMLPKVIFSSRTHSQLSQAVQELKRSHYRYMRSVVLGSRDQLCLHPEVSKASSHNSKMYMCRSKIRSKACIFYLNHEEKILSQSDFQESTVLDIEDLVTLGKRHNVCPYYATRNLKSKADIIFTPYNYIIDPKTRRAHEIELLGNILIFDEAHNIEGACEESMSFELRSSDLALCINEVTQTMELIKNIDNKDFSSSDNGAPDFTLTDLSILKVMFCELEEILDKAVSEQSAKDGSLPGDYVIEVLSKVELTPQRKDVVIELLDKIILYHSSNVVNVWSSKGAGLQKFSDLLSILFLKVSSEGFRQQNLKQEFSAKYRAFLQYEAPNKAQNNADPWAAAPAGLKKTKRWKLDCWCFSPSLGMREIVDRGVHSVILTSGTLSPLGPIINELGINFPVQLENPHIVKDNQIFVAIVTSGPDGTPLNSSYQNRSSESYISSLGRTICNFCRIVPNGLLVFFPSYSVMRSNITSWEDSGIWRTLSGMKQLFVEPQGKDAFQESIENYYAAVEDPSTKGATLLAVCRGKVSEGLDFADNNARAVVITGLPFPPFLDPRVKMKMNYLNSIAKENGGLYGNDWYVLQASRAVNQAIGRVIRHKDDYGAIILCDNRFKQKRMQCMLSKWIQGRIKVYDTYGPALKQLSSFFKALDENPISSKQSCSSKGGFQLGCAGFSATGLNESKFKTKLECCSRSTDENVFEAYRQPNNTGNSSKICESSIFDAIENNDKKMSPETPKGSSLAKYSDTSSLYSEESIPSCSSDKTKEPKRRKIAISYRQVEDPEKNKTSSEMWKSYLLEVKKILMKEQYEAFCSFVRDYKNNKDAAKFAVNLKLVFAQVPDKDKYLQKTSLLVSKTDRDKFLDLCS